jgi:uncharacterized protein
MKPTLVIGASENPERYSNKAMLLLKEYGHPVFAIGNREGSVNGIPIQKGQPDFSGINTVTLYLGPANQPSVYEYVVRLKPKRVIFNPGTENADFQEKLHKAGIEWEEACTLVLLRTGLF